MKHTYSPAEAPAYLRWMKLLDEGSKFIPEELFRWIAWASGIAALRIVRHHTDAWWLTVLWVALLFVLVARIQWFTLRKLRHPEVTLADGSVEVTFSAGRVLAALAVSAASWWFVIALSNAITSAGVTRTKAEQPEIMAPQQEKLIPPATDGVRNTVIESSDTRNALDEGTSGIQADPSRSSTTPSSSEYSQLP